MKEPELFSGKSLKDRPSTSNKFIINGILKGHTVSLLTGGSKTGKSTLALQIAYAVSKGLPFLGNETNKKDVLYLCLDNDDELISERLQLMGLDMDDNVFFCFDKSITLGNEEDSVETLSLMDIGLSALEKLPNLGLIIIDLFDNIRNLTIRIEANNIKDGEDMEFLIEVAQSLEVHILALNHDTKCGIQNGYRSSRGSVKLAGTINGAYLHLIRNGIGETHATLEIGGRNVREAKYKIQLNTDTLTYSLEEDSLDDEIPYEIGAIRNFIFKNNGYTGTISNLLQMAKLYIAANKASRLLNNHKDILESEGIHFYQQPGHSKGKIYVFNVDEQDD